ncbi:MAG: zinc ribbon domain-containing protein [Methanobacterium sp.]|nr:zinc ribbon domain-containing protein [Methanobacterium sp.]
MDNKILENVIYVLFGILIQLLLYFKLIELPELFMIIIGFIGFAAIVYGLLELAENLRERKTINPVIVEDEVHHINYCSNCGEEISFGTKYCPKCGHHITNSD